MSETFVIGNYAFGIPQYSVELQCVFLNTSELLMCVDLDTQIARNALLTRQL